MIDREQRQLLVVLAEPRLGLTITRMTNERKEVSANHTSKDPQPAAAGARTLAAPRQHLSRPRFRISRVLRSTLKRPLPAKGVGG